MSLLTAETPQHLSLDSSVCPKMQALRHELWAAAMSYSVTEQVGGWFRYGLVRSKSGAVCANLQGEGMAMEGAGLPIIDGCSRSRREGLPLRSYGSRVPAAGSSEWRPNQRCAAHFSAQLVLAIVRQVGLHVYGVCVSVWQTFALSHSAVSSDGVCGVISPGDRDWCTPISWWGFRSYPPSFTFACAKGCLCRYFPVHLSSGVCGCVWLCTVCMVCIVVGAGAPGEKIMPFSHELGVTIF